jgi:hypothetical protein
VRDLPRRADFLQQSRQCRRVAVEALWEQLDRHRLSEREVVCAVHLAHAPAAEQADDAVAAGKDGAWRELAMAEAAGIGAGSAWRGSLVLPSCRPARPAVPGVPGHDRLCK